MQWTFRLIGQFKKHGHYASVYGLILYSDAHPNVRSVIESDPHCRALNEISGPQWLVFASRQADSAPTKSRARTLDALYVAHHGSMSAAQHWPADHPPILEQLGLESKADLPCLLLLFPDEHGECLTHRIPINDASVDVAYQSLAESLALVTSAVGDLAPENWQNAEGVFSAVRFKLQSEQHLRMLKRVVPLVAWLLKKFAAPPHG